MRCLKCGSEARIKSGVQGDKQRYKCKGCGYHYTRETVRGMGEVVKQQAVSLYLEGLGIRAIARQVQVSHVAVLKWLKAAAQALPAIHLPNQSQAIELDELWHYEQKKSVSVGSGLLLSGKASNS